MKYLLLIVSLTVSLCAYSQTTKNEQAEIDAIIKTLPPCPKPKPSQFESLCVAIDNQDFRFFKELERMACVSDADNALLVKAKVQKLWNTWYHEFGCNSTGFSLENGNVLKYAVYSNMSILIGSAVKKYNLNINHPDPVDGKTLLDYVQEEIQRLEKASYALDSVPELKKLYQRLKTDFGAKHAVELK